MNQQCLLAEKGGKPYNMKYLAILALAAMAFGFGACAHHEAPPSTTTNTASTSSYSK
jgi:hypothetical protein